MSSLPHHRPPTPPAASTEPAPDGRSKPGYVRDLVGAGLDSVSRLGAKLLSSPVAVHRRSEAGETPFDLFDRLQPHLRFSAGETAFAANGKKLAELRLMDLRRRAPLGPREQAIFHDLATITSAILDPRDSVGRVDHVTLLPNRVQFVDDIGQRDEKGGALLLLTLADARHFNEILRALGHAYSDDFVRAGAQRLRQAVGALNPLYHVSVLSFACLVDRDEAESMAVSLVRAFAEPLNCNGLPIATQVGVGLAEYDGADHKPAESLRSVLTAAQDSRRLDIGWAWYDRKSDQAHVRAFMLLHDLESAIAAPDQLQLHYQPRVDMKSRRCVGAEALIRWTHPKLGAISPAEFIPLAEATTIINRLTDWVMAACFRQSSAWRRGGVDLRLAMNFSPNNLREADFVPRLRRELDLHDADPQRIELEFTEGALHAADGLGRAQLAAIRGLGIEIAIDDFGTGYSNMSYLTRLPINVLKIDRSFVRMLMQGEKDRLLVRAILDIAHGLGCRAVAEGIEDDSTFALLSQWGCDEGQGYLMSKPLAESQFQEWWRVNAAA